MIKTEYECVGCASVCVCVYVYVCGRAISLDM